MNLIMFVGDPFSGKSFLADKIKSFLEAEGNAVFILKTVVTRYKGKKNILFTAQNVDESIESTRIEKDKSYRALLPLAKRVLKQGGVPILDATFHKKYRREWIYRFCKKNNINLLVIHAIFTDKNAIIEQMVLRQANQDYKDNLLASIEAYELMVKQKDLLSAQEIQEYNLSVIQFNRDEKCINLSNFKHDVAFFNKVAGFLQKNI
ncbi:ATP-binding protein [Candidatus Woesearchaeota archaeon]|nr:ATP-binding protein [Candidatus Woesearchaeota archaeon]MBW3006138.1 ATP-binding protein [Candidatus Woesearchaeota archaeon]